MPLPRNRRHPNRTYSRRHAPVTAGSWSSSRYCPAQGAARSPGRHVPGLKVHDRKAIAHGHDRRAGIEPRSQILAQALADDSARFPQHSDYRFWNREPSRQIQASSDDPCHCAHRQIHRGRSIPIAPRSAWPALQLNPVSVRSPTAQVPAHHQRPHRNLQIPREDEL
jgi:hypothetical protein